MENQAHVNNHKDWPIQDDLKLLKNWNLSESELGQMFGRSNGAIRSRMSYLRAHPFRVKEVQRSFPEAVFEKPEPVRKTRNSRGKVRKMGRKAVRLNFAGYDVPQWLIDKYPVGGNGTYSIKELLFICEHLDASDQELADALDGAHTKAALSVKKSVLRKQLLDRNSFISKVIMDLKNSASAAAEDTRPVNLDDHSRTTPVFELPFDTVKVDWENKKLLFRIAV